MASRRLKDRRRRAMPVRDERRQARDRRAHPRVLVDLEVDYKCEDTFLFAYITDISAMGIFIRTSSPEPPGTQLQLRFRTPMGDEMRVEGRVRWINPFRPGSFDNINPGMGVQFVGLTERQRTKVLELVRTFAYLDADAEKPDDKLEPDDKPGTKN